MARKSKTAKKQGERGIALLFALFTLLALSAIAATLVLMTNTETSVNSNYRQERVSSFAAKSGMEEVRDRMSTLNTSGKLPTTFPPAAGSILYVLNEGAAAGTVQPWVATNAYMDDELCHDFSGVQGTQPATNIRCTSGPTSTMLVAGTTATPITSNYPWSGTSAALMYKWVRVTLKQNGSVQGYPVNGASAATTQICWNGSTEVPLSGAASCQAMTPSSNPVYMITSLAMSSTGTTRKMIQAEAAQNPAHPFPYGLFATGTNCPAITFGGGGNGNPATDSYNTANGGTYAGTAQNTLGDIGSNGGVLLTGHSMIGGAVSVPSLAVTPPSPCAGGDYTTTGTAGVYNPGNSFPGNAVVAGGTYSFPTPPDPVPAPPNTPYTGGNNLVPGTFGNISIASNTTLTLAPGVYNINSLTISGQASIAVSPAGAVTLNFPSTSSNPISLTGQAITSSGSIPNNMQINYGGTGTINLAGKAASYFIVDAPNAAISVSGNGDIYGRVVGKTIDYGGNGKFHFDRNSVLGPSVSTLFNLISLREVTY